MLLILNLGLIGLAIPAFISFYKYLHSTAYVVDLSFLDLAQLFFTKDNVFLNFRFTPLFFFFMFAWGTISLIRKKEFFNLSFLYITLFLSTLPFVGNVSFIGENSALIKQSYIQVLYYLIAAYGLYSFSLLLKGRKFLIAFLSLYIILIPVQYQKKITKLFNPQLEYVFLRQVSPALPADSVIYSFSPRGLALDEHFKYNFLGFHFDQDNSYYNNLVAKIINDMKKDITSKKNVYYFFSEADQLYSKEYALNEQDRPYWLQPVRPEFSLLRNKLFLKEVTSNIIESKNYQPVFFRTSKTKIKYCLYKIIP
ncbi:hypothetical protein ACFL5G_04420 [Candidatus Margulisiibacteriota bacterium]